MEKIANLPVSTYEKIAKLNSVEEITEFYNELANTYIPELLKTIGCTQNNKYHRHDVADHTINVINNCPNELIVRWAALFHDIGKPVVKYADEKGDHFIGHAEVSGDIAMEVMKRLGFKYGNAIEIEFLVRNHDRFIHGAKISKLRRFVGEYGRDRVDSLLILLEADQTDHINEEYGSHNLDELREKIKQVYAENSDISIYDLKITVKDLYDLGVTNECRQMKIMYILLNNCFGSPELNTKEWLVKEAKRLSRKKKIV